MPIRRQIALILRALLALSIPIGIALFVSTTGGCGKGLFPEVTPSNGTGTPTPVANASLYATNFNDGTVSVFGRDSSTGALTFVSKLSAGAAKGPQGIAVTPQNDFAYLVNSADGNVYQYSVNVGGNLTSIGKIAAQNTPRMLAIETSGAAVYVTNFGSKTLSEYIINSGNGTLTLLGTIGNFSGQPFGIVAHPSLEFVYVADSAGFIYPFAVQNDGTLVQITSAVNSLGGSRGNPAMMAIAVDSSQSYLLVADATFGVVATFAIQSDGSLVFGNTFGTGQSSTTFGIGAGLNSTTSTAINYVLTSNTNGNFVQPYQRTAAILTQQSAVGDSTGPTGLVVDPAGAFAYTANAGSATIAQIGINSSQCGSAQVCVIQNFASESPTNNNAGTSYVATTH